MACSRPNVMHYDGYEYKFRGRRNQEKQVFDLESQVEYPAYDVPCGKCQLCRVETRYSKALRIMLEAESYPGSTYFLTLTYNNENLGNLDLEHRDWAQFMKNFRQKFCQVKFCEYPRKTRRQYRGRSLTFKKVKQVMCGEYGDDFGRKHFHGIIFNHVFHDMVATGTFSKKGNAIFTSPSLESVWKKGHVQVEKITFDLALYVGSYVTDNLDDVDVNLGHEKDQYGRFGHGIGESWIRQWWRDVLIKGQVNTLERDYPVPRYFYKKIFDWYPEEYMRYREKNLLRSIKKKYESIEKGYGPLSRAKAKGRIMKHTYEKRRKDEKGIGSVIKRP